MCGRLERRWRSFLLTLATLSLLCLCLKDTVLTKQPSYVLHLQLCPNQMAQSLAQEGVTCPHLCLRNSCHVSHAFVRSTNLFILLPYHYVLVVGCLVSSLTLFSVLATRRMDTVLLNGRPAIRRAQLADRFSRAGG